MKIKFLAILGAASMLSSCAIIRPGEVGVKQKLGRLSDEINTNGVVFFNPFVNRIIKISVQTNNLELSLNLPSKEGLSVNSQISILYKLIPEQAPFIIKNLGQKVEPIIANVFRSASSDICSQYFAKDLHSGMRAEIEKAIKEKMMLILDNQGIQIDAVLMKSIQLPQGLSSSIEQKLQAEQDVMRMEFILKQTKLDAERKVIEAQGTSDAQKIISQGLTDEIIKIRSIEAFLELSKSPNSKIIITDGKAPLLINNDK
jgi:regulator of protease activity HflC (stomatin/prohibitin superfamily)